MKKRVTVIIPFLNGIELLRHCLSALDAQTYPIEELIAVNNGSTENFESLRKDFPRVMWHRETAVGSYAARNCGLRHATGEIIAFTDCDCIPDPHWLEEGISALDALSATIVGGRIALLDPSDRPLNSFEIVEELFFGLSDQKKMIEKQGFAATANVLAYRSVFDRVGTFDGTLKSSGDKEWGQRATAKGEVLRYAALALVYHPRRSSFREVSRKARRLVGGRITLIRREQNPMPMILADLYHQSIFNPRMHAFGLLCPRVSGLGRRLRFLLVVEVLSVVVFYEKLRVLLGGEATRA